jgi:ATP synthase protein I
VIAFTSLQETCRELVNVDAVRSRGSVVARADKRGRRRRGGALRRVVTAFFAISIIVVGRAARVNPMAMMVAALATFLGKIIAFMIVLAILRHSTAFNARDLGFTALACILAWSAAQVITSLKLKMLYVEPDGQS